MQHADYLYIKGVLSNDFLVLEEIYRKFLPKVFAMVRRNNGRFEDAKDVFQEALVVVFNHASRSEFRLTASFQAYLLGICRFVWLRQLKKNERMVVSFELEERYDIDADLETKIFESEQRNLYREKFAQIGDDCRQLLHRFFEREPLAQIANDMGYTPDYIKKKNRNCKAKLMDLIQNDTRYGELSFQFKSLKSEN